MNWPFVIIVLIGLLLLIAFLLWGTSFIKPIGTNIPIDKGLHGAGGPDDEPNPGGGMGEGGNGGDEGGGDDGGGGAKV